MINDTENLDIFTKGEFATKALIGGVETWGIFDEYYGEAFDLNTNIPVAGRKYCFKIQTAETVGLTQGIPVELEDGRLFEVVNKEPCPPDGKLTNLILKEL